MGKGISPIHVADTVKSRRNVGREDRTHVMDDDMDNIGGIVKGRRAFTMYQYGIQITGIALIIAKQVRLINRSTKASSQQNILHKMSYCRCIKFLKVLMKKLFLNNK